MEAITSNFATVERYEGVVRVSLFSNDKNFNLYQYYKDVLITIDAKGLLKMEGLLVTREFIDGDTKDTLISKGFDFMPGLVKTKKEIKIFGFVFRKKSELIFGFHTKERKSMFFVNGTYTLSV